MRAGDSPAGEYASNPGCNGGYASVAGVVAIGRFSIILHRQTTVVARSAISHPFYAAARHLCSSLIEDSELRQPVR